MRKCQSSLLTRRDLLFVIRGPELFSFKEIKPAEWISCRPDTATFHLQPGGPRPTLRRMFDAIRAEIITAADKLAHLRRFL